MLILRTFCPFFVFSFVKYLCLPERRLVIGYIYKKEDCDCRYKDANGETKYNDIFHPITAEARGELGKAIVAAYNQELATEQTTEQTEDPAQTMQQM